MWPVEVQARMWPTDIYLETGLFFSIAFPSPWKPDSDKSSEDVKELFVVAVVIDSMRWCCSALSFSLTCLGSNSASMCCYILWVFMKAFAPKKTVGLVAEVLLVAKVCLLSWPIRDCFSGKIAPRELPQMWAKAVGRKALHAHHLSTSLPGGIQLQRNSTLRLKRSPSNLQRTA